MDASEADIVDLAGAILDGTPVDWGTVASIAGEGERPLLEELRVLATLAECHRDQHVGDPQIDSEPPRGSYMWGHLCVLEPIGSGAFGHVYHAWDTRLDRDVALKLLPAPLDAAGARASSIIEEGRLLARVRHPNVVTIYGAERIGDMVGLWMERIGGETVEQRLMREPLPRSEAIEIGIQICHAVSAVHKAGLLHRDIKAQNVMLADDGRALLTDFGTGHEVEDASASASSLAGTPLYLAPELLRGNNATRQSDIYSLGVLLYHMVTGSYPVRARSLTDLRLAHERREPIDDTARHPELPRRLGRIIERAIDPDPERRYRDADALAAALGTLNSRTLSISTWYAAIVVGALGVAGWLAADGRVRHTAFASSAQTPVSLTAAVSAPSDRRTIAVLPLRNLNTEPGSDEFADGFTEEIINSLAANNVQLQVRSRASSFAFKNKPRDLSDIAGQLHVSFVLEGSMRRSRSRFQIEARLAQAPSGVTMWNDNFEGDLSALPATRDRITRSVLERLGLKPGHSRRAYDVNPDVYGNYLTARALVSQRGVGSAERAVEFFQHVIATDPAFAPAYAGLADAYAYMSLPTYQGMPIDKAQALMRTAALKALELDPELAEAHAAMGVVDARDLNWASSQRHFQQAIALDPSLSQVYTSYSFFTLRPLWKFDEAERLLNMALRSDPLSLDVWRELAELYFTVGRYAEAINLLERVRAVDPRLPTADVVLARALVFGGRIDEALALYREIDPPRPSGAQTHARPSAAVPHYQAYAYMRAGRRSEAEKLAAENRQYPYRATILYAALGDLDRAFEALHQTAEREPQRVPLLLTWPEIAQLRSDPRSLPIRQRFAVP